MPVFDLCWSGRFGWGTGLYFPESQVLEDPFNDLFILDHADYFHLSGTFRISQEGPHCIDFLDQSDPVLSILF